MTRDKALIDRLMHRDRSALEQVVRAHHGFLIAMVIPHVGPDWAENVVQEAWIRAFTALGRFEGRASLYTWLAQIAPNEARSRRGTRRRREGAGRDRSRGLALTVRLSLRGVVT